MIPIKLASPIGEAFCYLAAGALAAAAIATANAVGIVVAAAEEQQQQDDDPPAVIATKTVVTTHNRYLQKRICRAVHRSFHVIPGG